MRTAILVVAMVAMANAQLPGVQWNRPRRDATTTTTEEPEVVTNTDPTGETGSSAQKPPVFGWFGPRPPPPPPVVAPPAPPAVPATPVSPSPTPTPAPSPPALRPEPDSSDPIAVSTGTVAFTQVDYTSEDTITEALTYITNVEQIMSTGAMSPVTVQQIGMGQSNTFAAMLERINAQKNIIQNSRDPNLVAVYAIISYPDDKKVTINLSSASRRARRDARAKRSSANGLYEVTYYYVYSSDSSSVDTSAVSNVPAPGPEPDYEAPEPEPDRQHKTDGTDGTTGKGSKAAKTDNSGKEAKKAKSETKKKGDKKSKAKDGKKTKESKGLMSEQKAAHAHKTRLIAASSLTGFAVFAVLAVGIHRFRSKAAPSAESYALLPAGGDEM